MAEYYVEVLCSGGIDNKRAHKKGDIICSKKPLHIILPKKYKESSAEKFEKFEKAAVSKESK